MNLLDDPYPIYRDLRTYMPVCWDERKRVWLLSRHADVASALQDPRLGSSLEPPLVARMRASAEPATRALATIFTRQIEVCDPPEHARLRALVRKAFSLQDFAVLMDFTQRATNELLDAMVGARDADLIHGFAEPLPSRVILYTLGVEPEETAEFSPHVNELVCLFGQSTADDADIAAAADAVGALKSFVAAKLAGSRRRRAGSLLEGLASVQESDAALDPDDLIANVILLLAAGHGTTTNLIGNGLHALLRHRGELEKLLAMPTIIMRAVEELLRYESPIQSVGRTALADLRLRDHTIRGGDTVMLLLGSANRDEEAFTQPDRLDLAREPNPHLAFGHGAHVCLGAALARMQARVAIPAVLQRLSGLELLTEELRWHPSPSYRGLRSLPVAFAAGGRSGRTTRGGAVQ